MFINMENLKFQARGNFQHQITYNSFTCTSGISLFRLVPIKLNNMLYWNKFLPAHYSFLK